MITTTPAAASPRLAAETRLAERRVAPSRPFDTPLVGVAAAVAGGMGLAPPLAWVGTRPESAVALAVAALCGWLIAWRSGKNGCGAAFLLTAIVALSAAWSGAGWRLFTEDDLGRWAPIDAQPVCLEVVAASSPTTYPAEAPSPFRAIPSTERTVLEARVVRLRNGTDWSEVSGRCEVTVAGDLTGVAPGDRLRVFGQLRRPRPALNPGERDAAVADRAERRLAVVWTEAPECVVPAGEAAEGWLARHVATFRDAAIDSVDRRMPPAAAPLVKAMLLGDASALTEETYEAFRRTGTVHLLVVSGLHVGLVASLLPALAAIGLLPRRGSWVGSLVLVVAYVLVAGGRPPAVRAGVVAVGILVAALVGRRAISINSLAGAAVVVFALSPGAWQSAGTRLSFLAAATLIGVAGYAAKRRHGVVSPLERLIRSARSPYERVARRLGGWGAWGVGATLAVQLVTGPLVASEFHLVSPAAAPLALLVSPLLTATIASGLLTLALDALSSIAWPLEAMAAAAAAVTALAADQMGCAIQFASRQPGAGFWTAGPAPWWVVAWTAWVALAAAVAAYWPRACGVVWRTGLALVAAAFVPSLWHAAFPSDALRCSFIAVGHGSSTLVESPDGGVVLVDAGALGSPDRVADTIARTLWSRGVRRIDAVLLTHADTDHYNALPGLLERFNVDAVLTTTQMFPSWDDPADRSGPAELRRLLTSAGVPVRTTQLGESFALGATVFTVLHPDDIGVVGSDNANSLVVGVEHSGRRALLPGDLESPGLEALLAQEPYDCDVLLAPHHGSQRSDPAGFAAWCRPEAVVVSSGEPRGVAHSSYTAAGSEVWSTHDRGQITALLSPNGVRVASYRP